MPRLLLALAALLVLAACDNDDAAPVDATPTVGEVDVERFKTDVFLRTTELDADIAALEAEAATTDSAGAVAYDAVLTRLRDDRRRLQARLDSLRPLPQATFDTTTAAISAQADRLRRALDAARFAVASEPGALRARAREALAGIADRLAPLRREAAADTLRRATLARIDTLLVTRDRLLTRIDTTTVEDGDAEALAALRTLAATRILALRDSALVLAPDTTRQTLADEVERRREARRSE